MYETFMHTLRAFFGYGVLRVVLTCALGLAVIVFAGMLSPVLRQGLARMKQKPGWQGGSVCIASGVFKFLLIFLMIRLFITALVFQGGIFERQHGEITETNRSAVLMKWGYSHEQKEISVSHTRERTWVTRQLFAKGEGSRSDSFWKDEEAPPQPINGKRPKITGTKEEIRHVSVEQKSITSADIDVTIKSNPRKLGNANYAGYEDTWKFKYIVSNKSEFPTKAHMIFPLPAQTGLFDEMHLTVDGTDLLPVARVSNSSLMWDVDMQPGGTSTVEIGYRSRGLEYLRYIPRRMTQTGHYRISMALHGVSAEKLDYPIGSMPPAEDISTIKTTPYTLTWKLDNALTSYDIGIKLPEAEQPKYYFARLLRESPAGLIFLVIMLTLSRIMLREPVRLELVAILGTAYGLHYTFMGRLADLMHGFLLPFAVSTATMALIITWFRLKDKDRLFMRLQDAAIFLVIIVLYPLAVVDGDKTSFWMQLFYVGVLVHVCVLLVAARLGAKPHEDSIPSRGSTSLRPDAII
jgi:hypothetical protein